MTDSSETMVLAGFGQKVASPYLTSEAPDRNWGQPSLSHYIVVIDGMSIRGQLIEAVYPTVDTSQPEKDDTLEGLLQELKSWDAASDEDFLGFETQLD